MSKKASISLLVGICLIPLIVKYLFYPEYPGSDDSFIHLKIIENYVNGFGWGVNKGVNVNLSTSPAYTIMMVMIYPYTNNLLSTGMLISSIASCLSVLSVYLISRLYAKHIYTAFLIAIFFAINVFLWRWTGTFMETTIATAAVLWCLYFFLITPPSNSKAFSFIGMFVAFAVLLRPETGVIIFSFLIHSLINDRKNIIKNYSWFFIGFMLIMTIYIIFSIVQFNHLVPSTYYAKSSNQLILFNYNVLSNLTKTILIGAPGVLLTLVYLKFQGCKATETKDLLRKTSALWTFALFFLSFYYFKVSYMQSPARYFLPIMYLLPLSILLVEPRNFTRKFKLATQCIASASLVYSLVVNFYVISPVLIRIWDEYIGAMKGAAIAINDISDIGNKVYITSDLGVVSYTLDPDLTIIDGGKLASPEIIGMKIEDVLSTRKPEYIVETFNRAGSPIEKYLDNNNIKNEIIWDKEYLSHGITHPNKSYRVKVYRLKY